MERQSLSDCLSSIDFAIVENVQLLSIKSLEDIHNHFLRFRRTGYIENKFALSNILKQINCIVDNFSSYEDDESFYNEYVEMRRLIIDWVVECDKEAEVNDQEYCVSMRIELYKWLLLVNMFMITLK